MNKNADKIISKKGFTILEVLIVFATLVVISVAGSGFYKNYSKNVEINTTAQTISAELRQMQSKSMTGEGGLKWGIHFINGSSQYYELFSTPTDYDDASKVIISTNYLPIGITFSDPAASSSKDIIFSRITGLASSSSISITASGVTQTISVTSVGTVSYGSPYGNVVVGTSYNITAIQGANGSITPAGVTAVASGGSQTYNITPSVGYSVATLTVDGAFVTPASSYTFSNVTATHTISATFSVATYTITATQSANGTISPSGVVTKSYGTSQAYTITPSSGYYVSALTIDGGAVTPNTSYTFSNISANHTITATFTLITFNITATQSANGTISPSGVTAVAEGGSQAYSITPSTGYYVSALTIDGGAVTPNTSYTFSNVTTTHTITATFSILTYAITVTQSSNGTISPGTTTKNYGTNQAFTITPSDNYHIETVTVDGSPVSATSPYTFSNITTTHTITATYAVTCGGTIFNGYCWYKQTVPNPSPTCSTTCTAAGATCVANTQTGLDDYDLYGVMGVSRNQLFGGMTNRTPEFNASGQYYQRTNGGSVYTDQITRNSCGATINYWMKICSCSQ
ncbi:MAG: hypothetical protein WCO07_00685 [bacterium]